MPEKSLKHLDVAPGRKTGDQVVFGSREWPVSAEVRRTHGLHANPFLLYPWVIVSMAWLPQVRAQRLLRGGYAQAASPEAAEQFAFDVPIVDEAHHVAPSSPSAMYECVAPIRAGR